MDYEGVKKLMLDKLSRELSNNLYYHDLSHTLDVLQSAQQLMESENTDAHEQILIKTACVFHDSGMLKTYNGHEEVSCEMADLLLPQYGYKQEDIKMIKKMIMTTKLPQSATLKMEKIICDADLDYLGRKDFFMISHRLKYEWDIHNIRLTTLKEWYQLQVSFLSNHSYFTRSAIQTREAGKQHNLHQIIEMLSGSK
ncbi:MAG TPA: HD domain-containing protein [Bacteroidales bacterium]|nr:HD domain-containing protein [Bacteroidales bacterium]